MIISADTKDLEGYSNLLSLVVENKRNMGDIQVFINGEWWKWVLSADDEEGWADVARLDDVGRVCLNENRDGIAIDRVYGNVEFLFKEEE